MTVLELTVVVLSGALAESRVLIGAPSSAASSH